MSRFVNIGFYDLASLFATYTVKHKRGHVESASPRHKNIRILELVMDREKSPVLEGWPQAQTFLQKTDVSLSSLPKKASAINAYILAYAPGALAEWDHEDIIDPESFMRLHVLLNPSPGFRDYSDSEMIAPMPWHAYVSDHRGHVSQSNFSAPNTAHVLTLELALDVAD